MENKILNRITELSSKINDLLSKREELIKELRVVESNIDIVYNSIHELKTLMEPGIADTDQSQQE